MWRTIIIHPIDTMLLLGPRRPRPKLLATKVLGRWQAAANDAAETFDWQPWPALLLFEDDLGHGGGGQVLLGGLVDDSNFVAIANQSSNLLESHIVRILGIVQLPVRVAFDRACRHAGIMHRHNNASRTILY